MRKPVFRVSDQVRHKPGCTAIEDGYRLKFWIKKEEGLYYLCGENKGADQLRGYREADLRLCFRIGKNPFFSGRGSSYIADVVDQTCQVRGLSGKFVDTLSTTKQEQ